MFTFLFFYFFTFFLFIIKSSTSTFFKEELKEYVITICKCDKNDFFKQQFFFNLIKAECVHMHTDNFNLKKFNVTNWQSINLCWLKTHMTIQHVSSDKCLKIVLKTRMLSWLIIMNLQVIIDNAFHILKKLIKQKNQRLMMIKKLSTMLQCFKLMKVNVKAF